MKRILLPALCLAILTSAEAQKKKEKTTAYAITAAEKGSHRWMEVNLIDVTTGERISPVYESKSEVDRLNARTGKPIVIKSPEQLSSKNSTTPAAAESSRQRVMYLRSSEQPARTAGSGQTVIVRELINTNVNTTVNTHPNTNVRVVYASGYPVQKEQPFATNSAACALDEKHGRLYYTPMGINQLRFIDLKAKKPTVYYFEDESFGSVQGLGDVNNQITRMVIASDGKGYALTNDAQQLLRFSTRKKAEITNLGTVSDDASNGKMAVGSRSSYGGDMVADDKGNLILITASRRVYRISTETMVAKYLGSIKGLPEGYTTNGAVVEKGTGIIVSSSSSTQAYYRFDIETLQAEKIETGGTVYNASDLANANLLTYKKEKEEQQPAQEIIKQPAETTGAKAVTEKSAAETFASESRFSVYPNPVVNSVARISLANYPEGRYELQLVDLSGKLLSKQTLQVNSKSSVAEFRMPAQLAKGTYLVQLVNSAKAVTNAEKILVQ
jgi:hypothetical protein